MSKITLKGIIDEDFVNYRVPSMVLMSPRCSFKCGNSLCQNSGLINEKDIVVDINSLCERYVSNPITEAVVFQGLEPCDTFEETLQFICCLRNQYNRDDDVVIYTGYTKEELADMGCLIKLIGMPNIIIKYGRYVADNQPHYDEILGIRLASDNQYAERIS